MAFAPAMASGDTCDRVARPGADPALFVRSLNPGRTGCLPGRTYRTGRTIRFSRPNVTLQSQPGERATIVGRVWVDREADGVTIQDMNLDGHNSARQPSPTVNGSRATFRRNDVTNGHTASCFFLGSSSFGRARKTRIVRNRIHDCGLLPATNHQHGIYAAHATKTIIRGNVIYGNADRGIQLYPDADGSKITRNVIRGNGQGLIFGGDSDAASQRNLVARNVIKNSRIRFNVEAHWQGPVGHKNYLRYNCVFGGARGHISGGIEQPRVGFKAKGNSTRKSKCKR